MRVSSRSIGRLLQRARPCFSEQQHSLLQERASLRPTKVVCRSFYSSPTVLNIKDTRSPEEVLESFANLDHTRSRRTGFPEAVFAEGKTAEQVAIILDDMARSANESAKAGSLDKEAGVSILATRYDLYLPLFARTALRLSSIFFPLV